jgi:hypothetical protein
MHAQPTPQSAFSDAESWPTSREMDEWHEAGPGASAVGQVGAAIRRPGVPGNRDRDPAQTEAPPLRTALLCTCFEPWEVRQGIVILETLVIFSWMLP